MTVVASTGSASTSNNGSPTKMAQCPVVQSQSQSPSTCSIPDHDSAMFDVGVVSQDDDSEATTSTCTTSSTGSSDSLPTETMEPTLLPLPEQLTPQRRSLRQSLGRIGTSSPCNKGKQSAGKQTSTQLDTESKTMTGLVLPDESAVSHASTAIAKVVSPSNMALKPLIAKFRLNGDGTPIDRVASRSKGSVMERFAVKNELFPSIPVQQPVSTPHRHLASVRPTTITLPQLATRMLVLFPSLNNQGLSTANCIASRIFACFSLDCDARVNHRVDITAPSPAKRPRRDAKTLVSLEPILPTLSALVDLEIALLDEKQGECTSRRRVHFAAFDGSALQPPSDVMEHSHLHNLSAITGLQRVLEALDTLRRDNGKEGQHLLQKLADYLTHTFHTNGHSHICSRSMSTNEAEYPVQRILKAAARYADDLQQLLSEHWWNTTDSERSSQLPLPWRCRLADATAQLVRYWLRTELNPVPDRAASEKFSKEWNNRVCHLVTLENVPGLNGADTAVNDGSLSSLVSNAASHICSYFGTDWKDWKTKVDEISTDFHLPSELCQTGIANSSPSSKHRRRLSQAILIEYTPQEWDELTRHVEASISFLAAVNRAKFLFDLLSIISQHDEHQTSWQNTIQSSACQLEACGTECVLEDDLHLLLLRFPPLTLLEQLPILINWKRKQGCEAFLQLLPKKFLFGRIDTKKARRKKSYEPFISRLEEVYEQGISTVSFPAINMLC